MYICLYVYTYICVCLHVSAPIGLCVSMSLFYRLTCMFIVICICLFVTTGMYIFTYVCIHMYIRRLIYESTHVHISRTSPSIGRRAKRLMHPRLERETSEAKAPGINLRRTDQLNTSTAWMQPMCKLTWPGQRWPARTATARTSHRDVSARTGPPFSRVMGTSRASP